MEVVRITPRGYCHGVVDAIRIAQKVGDEADEEVHMLGMLVHNHHITDSLAEHGVKLIDALDREKGLDRINSGIVIFTAHGISPLVKQKALDKGLKIVDATCSDVLRTHDLIDKLLKEDFEVIYIGRRNHPEPEGSLGHGPGRIHLIENAHDLALLDIRSKKIALTCQTTLSVWDTDDLISKVKEKYPQVQVHNEICSATQERQEAAVLAAATVDIVIVVGSSRSSNSLRLVEVVEKRAGKKAYLVDSELDLKKEWFINVERVGVTSGASTPTKITRKVVETLESWPVSLSDGDRT